MLDASYQAMLYASYSALCEIQPSKVSGALYQSLSFLKTLHNLTLVLNCFWSTMTEQHTSIHLLPGSIKR